MIKTEDIETFIEKELVKKIFRELKYEKFGIVSETDLQSVAYLYLKKYLAKESRYKVYNKIYLTQSRKTNGIYPDIAILRKMSQPRITIEFKERHHLEKKYVINDMKKLYGLKGMQRGYLIYLTRETDKNSDNLTGHAEEMGKKYLTKVTPLVINAFDKIPRSQHDKWEQKWKKYSKLRIKARK